MKWLDSATPIDGTTAAVIIGGWQGYTTPLPWYDQYMKIALEFTWNSKQGIFGISGIVDYKLFGLIICKMVSCNLTLSWSKMQKQNTR